MLKLPQTCQWSSLYILGLFLPELFFIVSHIDSGLDDGGLTTSWRYSIRSIIGVPASAHRLLQNGRDDQPEMDAKNLCRVEKIFGGSQYVSDCINSEWKEHTKLQIK
jgi:hypothetical protein